MDNGKIIVPTKEEVKRLLVFAMSDKATHMQTVGELLGMKWADSLLPNIRGPEWGYDGLKMFFEDHRVANSDTLKEALNKLE